MLAILAMICLIATSKAQIQQGNALVGADIADLSLGLNEGSAFSFSINPKVGFFVRSGLALGLYLNFSLINEEGTSVDYGIGALGRYYFHPTRAMERNNGFFAEGTVGIEGTNPASGENTNGLGLTIGPGWTYFLTSTVGVEALVKYRGIIGFGQRPTSSALNLEIGFQIYLSKERAERRATGK